jgi:glycerophosphoryl diester phosphodiesterase
MSTFKRYQSIILYFLFTLRLTSQESSVWETLNYERNKVLVAAHRGDWKNYPENSLEGIKSCIDRGIDVVEIDVQKTSDGSFILMHDPTVRRTTNGKKRVSSYSLSEITKLRLRDKNGKLTSFKVPTVEEALKIAKGNIILNLDKSGGHFKELLILIEKYNCGQNVILKGDGPAEFFRNSASIDKSGTLFMPIIMGRRTDIDTFVMNSQASLIEVLLRTDSDAICKRELLNKLNNLNCKIWYNALFNSISGGHTESQNAISAWKWFIDHDAKVIQTDYPFELLQYLIDNGLHDIPKGFKSVNLNALPNNKTIQGLNYQRLPSDSLELDSAESKAEVYIPEEEFFKKNIKKVIKSNKEKNIVIKYHKVKKGESLIKIGLKHNTSIKKILKLNPKLKLNSKLKIGTRIRIA